MCITLVSYSVHFTPVTIPCYTDNLAYGSCARSSLFQALGSWERRKGERKKKLGRIKAP